VVLLVLQETKALQVSQEQMVLVDKVVVVAQVDKLVVKVVVVMD